MDFDKEKYEERKQRKEREVEKKAELEFESNAIPERTHKGKSISNAITYCAIAYYYSSF